MIIRARLNGEAVSMDVEATEMLVDTLRSLGLTGTKEGCGVGVCGVCTVALDDRPVSSCLFLSACADGADIWTVEGITECEPALAEAYVRHEGLQCGICTPGQVVAAYTLRREHPGADEEVIREYLAGNLCRCTGYNSIIESVRAYLAAG